MSHSEFTTAESLKLKGTFLRRYCCWALRADRFDVCAGTYVVTGGNRGIGRAYSYAIAQAGGNVAMIYRYVRTDSTSLVSDLVESAATVQEVHERPGHRQGDSGRVPQRPRPGMFPHSIDGCFFLLGAFSLVRPTSATCATPTN